MASEFQVIGTNAAALFTLKLHRGDGMVLIAMNWKKGKPPVDFVGFAIEYREPGGDRFFALKNRLTFRKLDGSVDANTLSTRLSPIQKFRWVHFPRNADMAGDFKYKVTPVFMNASDELSYGEPQVVAIELQRETFPGQLNVTFTRGFVSSQAFVDRFESAGPVSAILPANAADGLSFKPTHPKAKEALEWMGFEARDGILEVLDQAIAAPDTKVQVIAYDLNEPEIVTRLQTLGSRLRVIIDDSAEHGETGSAEDTAEARLRKSAGTANVKRQHMLGLQHNKTIVVSGSVNKVVCGSTNFSWRGFYVQSNNAIVLTGKSSVAPFSAAFESYFTQPAAAFGTTSSAHFVSLGLAGINASVAFSPHAKANALLETVAADVRDHTTSCLFYSLAFLFQTEGAIRDAIEKVTGDTDLFVYGISDRKVGGLDLQKPDGNVAPVFPAALTKNVPPPFSLEPTGGGGIRMHHKFLVVDFDKPDARVYLGSYNFSSPADIKNGENLLLIRDRRVAVSYVVEALRIFDHYHFRVAQAEASKAKKDLVLARPPRKATEKPWWDEHYTVANRIRDRELFA